MILSKKEKSIVALVVAFVLTILLTVCLTQCGDDKTEKDYTITQDNSVIEPVEQNGLSTENTETVSTADSAEQPQIASSDFELKLNYYENNGEMYYTLKRVTVVKNLYDAQIALNELDSSVNVSFNVGTEQQANLINPLNENPRFADKARYIDKNTGTLADNCYLLLFELDVTNNSLKNTFNSWSQENIFTFNTLPEIIVKRDDGGFDPSFDICYFNESGKCAVDQYPCFELNIGEIKSFVVGYIVYDASENPLSQLGFSYKWEYPFNQNNVIHWFDLSKLAAKLQ